MFAATARDYKTIYERKLEIIQRNIYGSDISAFAVQMAMLRLWLSLVVDNDAPVDAVLDGRVDVSLPNLRFKIVQGDALTARVLTPAELAIFGEEYRKDAENLRRLHEEYFQPPANNSRDKTVIEKEIEPVIS